MDERSRVPIDTPKLPPSLEQFDELLHSLGDELANYIYEKGGRRAFITDVQRDDIAKRLSFPRSRIVKMAVREIVHRANSSLSRLYKGAAPGVRREWR